MSKLKQSVAWLLGMFIAKLKGNPVVKKIANYLRTSYPGPWRAIAKKLRSLYWTYQAHALDESDDAFFKDLSVFSEQQWQRKQSQMRAHSSESIRNGVMNNRPAVEPAVLLERINRSAALKQHSERSH